MAGFGDWIEIVPGPLMRATHGNALGYSHMPLDAGSTYQILGQVMQRAWSEHAVGFTSSVDRPSALAATPTTPLERASTHRAGVYLLKLTEHTWGLSDLLNKSK